LVEHTGEGDSKHMVARDPLRGVLHYLESIQR
jgi:hypothetical protein